MMGVRRARVKAQRERDELAELFEDAIDELHAEVQQPLRHLATQHRLAHIDMGSQFLYTAFDPVSRRNQTAGPA